MQFQVSKKTLQQQVRPPIREKKLKNQDRILYVKGLFNPPPTETSESVMGTKVLDQWRNVLSLGVLTAFLMLMMMVSIIGDYGILSSHQLQDHLEIAPTGNVQGEIHVPAGKLIIHEGAEISGQCHILPSAKKDIPPKK